MHPQAPRAHFEVEMVELDRNKVRDILMNRVVDSLQAQLQERVCSQLLDEVFDMMKPKLAQLAKKLAADAKLYREIETKVSTLIVESIAQLPGIQEYARGVAQHVAKAAFARAEERTIDAIADRIVAAFK